MQNVFTHGLRLDHISPRQTPPRGVLQPFTGGFPYRKDEGGSATCRDLPDWIVEAPAWREVALV